MTVHRMTIEIPETVFVHLRQRAEQSCRPVEVEAVEALVASVSDDGLPVALASELEALATLDDGELLRMAAAGQPKADAARLEALHWLQQARPLTPDERDEEQALLYAHDQAMLRRAQAMALLRERGHDLTALVQPE